MQIVQKTFGHFTEKNKIITLMTELYFRVLDADSLSHCPDSLGHLNRTEPSLMLIVTLALFLT